MRAIAASLLAMVVLAAADEAAASTLSVAPIRVELSSAKRTAVLTVRNQDDSPVVVQARPAAWSQPQGSEDQLDDTRDLLVTPPLFTVPAKGQQVLRIALLREPDTGRELPYRLVLSEVPSASVAATTGLRVALRITLPVFIAAPVPTSADVVWTHQWLADGSLRIDAQNRGTAHVQILDFDVQNAAHLEQSVHQASARYLLPGSSTHWQLQPDSGLPRDTQIVIHGHSDSGDFTAGPGAP